MRDGRSEKRSREDSPAGGGPPAAPPVDLPGAALVVVAAGVGSRLGPWGTAGGQVPLAGQRVIHVYPDADSLGREFDPTLALVAEPGVFLESLARINAPDPVGLH